MKTIKIDEAAWSVLQEYKLTTKAKNMSQTIMLLATTMYYYNEVIIGTRTMTPEQFKKWLKENINK